MTIEPRAPNPPSEPSFPLNVQAGSPQYTLTSQITPASSTTFITVTNTDSIEPISNAYYTIQNEDGSKWCTFYIGQWTKESTTNYYTGACTYSSSNTSDVFPVGSVCWCIWTKEYYDSLIAHSAGIQNITAVYSPISGNNNPVIVSRGGILLPMVPGVTYSGQLRCAGYGYNETIRFTDAGFGLISEVTVQSSPTIVTIPEGTKCVVSMAPASSYRRIEIYPHTVTYQ